MPITTLPLYSTKDKTLGLQSPLESQEFVKHSLNDFVFRAQQACFLYLRNTCPLSTLTQRTSTKSAKAAALQQALVQRRQPEENSQATKWNFSLEKWYYFGVKTMRLEYDKKDEGEKKGHRNLGKEQ